MGFTRIRITNARDSKMLRLMLGIRKIEIPTTKAADVPDWALPILDDSNHSYEILPPVAGQEEAEVGAGGSSGDASAEVSNVIETEHGPVKVVPVPDEHRLPNERRPARDPLDHDGKDGRGGSLKGAASTAAKGKRRKRAKKAS